MRTFHVNLSIWGLVAVLGWLSLPVLGMLNTLRPASQWFEASQLTVADTIEGTPPVMSVQRTIHRDFWGEWIVAVRRIDDGSLDSICLQTGRAPYKAGAKYPDRFDLDRWTRPNRCSLPPGKYQIETRWKIELADGVNDKFVSITSNVFTVAPR